MKTEYYFINNDTRFINIAGDDRQEFLQGLITNDINACDRNNPIYSCILSPQGKFLADFFIQPEIKVSSDYMEAFTNIAFETFKDKEILFDRAIKLFPMFQIKWCCIIMNEFLPEIAERRIFSAPELNIEELKYRQLAKAKSILSEIIY